VLLPFSNEARRSGVQSEPDWRNCKLRSRRAVVLKGFNGAAQVIGSSLKHFHEETIEPSRPLRERLCFLPQHIWEAYSQVLWNCGICVTLVFSQTTMVGSAANRRPSYQSSQKPISRIRISIVMPNHGIRNSSTLTWRAAGKSLSTFASRSKNR